jgi:UDPglucose--hexose-1-phosphate uridylyltransferase
MESDPATPSTQWRHDFLTDRRVIIAGNRGNRPGAYSQRMNYEPIQKCPFCLGNESESPIEISLHRLEGSKNPWDVRVVGNLYPALELKNPKGFGKHEVIAESADHIGQFGQLSIQHIALVLRTWQERLKAVRTIPNIRHAVLFKNNGPAAGASLEHCHSQLVALDHVPNPLASELHRCVDYKKSGASYFDDWVKKERQFGERVLSDAEGFFAFCPEVSGAPYEMCILPKDSSPCYEDVKTNHFIELATLVKRLLGALSQLDNPDFNIILHQAPFNWAFSDDELRSAYSWRMEIIPRMTVYAGFEWSTGYSINTVPPERAAEKLRDWLSVASSS